MSRASGDMNNAWVCFDFFFDAARRRSGRRPCRPDAWVRGLDIGWTARRLCRPSRAECHRLAWPRYEWCMKRVL